MKTHFAVILIFGSTVAGGEPPRVDSRLASAVEQAVKATGFRINVSETTSDSLNINKINGRNVCEPSAFEDARRFQDEIGKQPNIRNNFGPAYYATTKQDGSIDVASAEQLVSKGVIKGCTNIYVRVQPR